MNTNSRSYRKNLDSNGLIYIAGTEREVSVSNLSMTGALVHLEDILDAVQLSETLTIPTVIDFFLPKLRLAGTAEVVRIDKEDDEQVSLALQFKDISYNINKLLYARKVYRKNMSVAGRILLGSKYYDFHTLNVSVEGLMIQLTETVDIVQHMTTMFEFDKVNVTGEVEVIWTDVDSEGRTLLGLKYINTNTSAIKGLPRFHSESGC